MMKKMTLLLLGTIVFFFSVTILTVADSYDAITSGCAYRKAMSSNEVEQIPSGVVVSAPKLLKADMWIMEVELTRDAKDSTRLRAVTSQPELFRIGDKIEIYSVLTSSKNGYRDMFYIAVKPEAK
ncbi:MAG: hypothetical protein NTZ49_02990 [Candidatus Parcubacteria bacterium]|nr:hypothetical protein [Candidatus Parcubacteria bacterium]